MSVKILVFPVLIILSLTLLIGYIKPDIENIYVRREEIKQSQDDLSKVDTVIKNIQMLNVAINERQEAKNFVLKYLPRSLEEERVLDTINFLATQSGVVVTTMDVKQTPPKPRIKESATTHVSTSFKALDQPTGASTPDTMPTLTVQGYETKVTVLGTYESIKDFLERLYRTDRLYELRSWSVQSRTKSNTATPTAEDKATSYPDAFLEAAFDADFVHFPVVRVNRALNMALFQKNTFDFSAVDSLLQLVNSPLPTLEPGDTGRPNPFQ